MGKCLIMLLKLLWVVLAYHGCSVCAVQGGEAPLHIGVLFPLAEEDGWSRYYGHAALVGMRLAVEDINNSDEVLSNYTIVPHLADTEVILNLVSPC